MRFRADSFEPVLAEAPVAAVDRGLPAPCGLRPFPGNIFEQIMDRGGL
jgi:hypothetical protein